MTKGEALAAKVKSREGKNQYTQGDKRGQVASGWSDCSSLQRWAYKEVLGIDIGDNTEVQILSSKLKTVLLFLKNGIPDVDSMQPGDLLFFRGTNTARKSSMYVGHVEMYVGNGQLSGHGSGRGPTRKDLKSYCRTRQSASSPVPAGNKGLICVRRAVVDTSGTYAGSAWSSASTGATSGSAQNTIQSTASETQAESVEITKVVCKSVTGSPGAYKFTELKDMGGVLAAGCEILIQNDKVYMPVVTGEITLEYSRKNTPGQLKFSVIKDDVLNIQEGNPVSFRVDGRNIFYGYFFSRSVKDKNTIELTCYDQLRYLKNKDTLVYSNKKYSELLRMIADDYGLTCGDVEDTGHVIAGRIEEATLFDILGNASDETVLNTGRLYVLYDNFGRLRLENIQSMVLPILIDQDTASDYGYTSTIDKDVYNRIKIAWDNSTTGEREIYVANDTDSQANWGVLQYYDKADSAEVAKEKANVLLSYYNKVQRELTINKAFGDVRVRGGSSLVVMMDLGDVKLQNFMVVEKVRHTFANGEHLMNLNVSGVRGEFNV